MARIRTIKPDFFTNEGMSTVSEPAQLLAAALLCYADDEGFFNAHPGLIKAAVSPLREPSEPIPQMLEALASIGYARFGTGKDGRRYGHIVQFSVHQKVSHPAPSKIKNSGIVWEVSGGIREASAKATAALRPELNLIELNRSELNVTEISTQPEQIEKPKHPDGDFKPSECAPHVCRQIGIGGQANWTRATEAIENYMHANQGKNAKDASEDIAALWPKYQASPQYKRFPMNPEKWLSSGEFLRSENWSRVEQTAAPPKVSTAATDASEMIRDRQAKIKAFKATNGKA